MPWRYRFKTNEEYNAWYREYHKKNNKAFRKYQREYIKKWREKNRAKIIQEHEMPIFGLVDKS
jgi:hypothetical protein